MVYAIISNKNLARWQGVHLNRIQTRQEKRQGGKGQPVPSRGIPGQPPSTTVVTSSESIRESILPGDKCTCRAQFRDKARKPKSRNRQVIVRQATIYN